MTVRPIALQSMAAQGQPKGHSGLPGLSDTRALGMLAGRGGGVMGGDPHNAFLTALQTQCSLDVTLRLLLAPLGL